MQPQPLTIQDIETIREARHLVEHYGNWRQARALDAVIQKLAPTAEVSEQECPRRLFDVAAI